MTIRDYSSLFATIRTIRTIRAIRYSLFATIRCSLFAIRDYSLFAIRVFQTPGKMESICQIETLVKVWENLKELWKHSSAARVPTAFLVLPNFHSCFYLTNGDHVAVRLYSNRTQMTSKCGENKKVAHEAIAECVTDVLTTF